MPRLELGLRLTGNPSPSAGFPNNYSLSFDGSNDHVTCGTNTNLEPDNVSVSLWVKHDGATGYQYVAGRNHSGGYSAYAIMHRAGNTFEFYVNTGSGILQSPKTPSASIDGIWTHLVGTYDGSFVRLYKDGVEVGSGTDTSSAGSVVYGVTQTFEIGAFRGALPIPAIIDEVGVFDTAISAADVTAIYNSGTPNDLTGSGSYDADRTGNLMGYWRFEEGTDTEVADSSTNSNTGTLINGPTWSTDVPAS